MSTTTESRRRLVRRLLTTQIIATQEQLRTLLHENGHDVTQATVSRDLDAVGAVKISNDHYEIAPDSGRRSRLMVDLRRVLDQFVRSVAVSGQIVVVRVPPGAAHLVAGKLDATPVDGVLGTVAGDDTILVVADGDATEIARLLEGARPAEGVSILEGNGG